MMVTGPLTLSATAAAGLLGMSPERVDSTELLRTHNHTWRVSADRETFFVKAHTKDWYDTDPASSVPVRHEMTGHRLLRAAGLPGLDVVGFSLDRDNALGWPYLVTRRAGGAALTDVLDTTAPAASDRALEAVGECLSRIHSLTFDQPGYLIDGPPAPPRPNQWMHWLSRKERFLLYAFENLTADAATVELDLRDAAAALLARTLPELRRAYQPLRFVHGDCHANVFHLDHEGPATRVSGVLDMENCSAGAPVFDFAKLFIELAGRRSADTRWWTPLFRGYREEPSFDLIRALLVGHAHINYTCHGAYSWPGSRGDILRHILSAKDWAHLLDLRLIGSQSQPRRGFDAR
jgi:Ser/Thr protein kinase RdoA (MazF antagonist)